MESKTEGASVGRGSRLRLCLRVAHRPEQVLWKPRIPTDLFVGRLSTSRVFSLQLPTTSRRFELLKLTS